MSEFRRIPLTVDAIFSAEGTLKPRKIITKDGIFAIDRVLKIQSRTPVVVPCIAPIEYTVIVEGHEKAIYFEPHSRKWFSVKEYE